MTTLKTLQRLLEKYDELAGHYGELGIYGQPLSERPRWRTLSKKYNELFSEVTMKIVEGNYER